MQKKNPHNSRSHLIKAKELAEKLFTLASKEAKEDLTIVLSSLCMTLTTIEQFSEAPGAMAVNTDNLLCYFRKAYAEKNDKNKKA